MSFLFSVIALALFGFGLGAVAGRDLAAMSARFSGSANRIFIPYGLGKRLALFLLGLTLGAMQGAAGVVLAAAGYLAGFALFAGRALVRYGR